MDTYPAQLSVFSNIHCMFHIGEEESTCSYFASKEATFIYFLSDAH